MGQQALTTSEQTGEAPRLGGANLRTLAAHKIKQFREVNALTATELAAQLGVSQPTVCYWESGAKVPRTTMQGVLHQRGICSPTDWHVPAPVANDDGSESAD